MVTIMFPIMPSYPCVSLCVMHSFHSKSLINLSPNFLEVDTNTTDINLSVSCAVSFIIKQKTAEERDRPAIAQRHREERDRHREERDRHRDAETQRGERQTQRHREPDTDTQRGERQTQRHREERGRQAMAQRHRTNTFLLFVPLSS